MTAAPTTGPPDGPDALWDLVRPSDDAGPRDRANPGSSRPWASDYDEVE